MLNTTIINRVVAVADGGGVVTVFDGSNGAELWDVDLGAGPIYSSVYLLNSTLYVVTYSGFLHALSLATGERIWSVELHANVVADMSSDLMELLYIASVDTTLCAFPQSSAASFRDCIFKLN